MSKNTNNLHNKLNKIQTELNAPKNMYNSFGKYKYRNLEGILEGLKPLLKETETTVVIDDEVVAVLDRVYIKAIVTLSDGIDKISVSAFARESETKKGMDLAQISGACSSYARKYACNGLFAIDDTKDADSMDNSGNGKAPFEHTDYKKPSQADWMQKNKLTAKQLIIINDLLAEIGSEDIEEKTQKWLLGYQSTKQGDTMINKLKGMINNG